MHSRPDSRTAIAAAGALGLVILLAAISLGRPPEAAAKDSYAASYDYQVACLDLRDGTMRWTTTKEDLPRCGAATFSVVDGTVLLSARSGRAPGRLAAFLDLGTGEILGKVEFGKPQTPVESVDPPLPEHRHEPSAQPEIELEFDRGNTHDLVGRLDRRSKTFASLADYPGVVTLLGNRAITAPGNLADDGGWLEARDLPSGDLAWRVDLLEAIGEKKENRKYTHVAVRIVEDPLTAKNDAIIVVCEDHLLRFDRDGKKVWSFRLPEQPVRRYDSMWVGETHDTAFGLLMPIYEDLVMVDLELGEVRWTFDGGPFGVNDVLVADLSVVTDFRRPKEGEEEADADEDPFGEGGDDEGGRR